MAGTRFAVLILLALSVLSAFGQPSSAYPERRGTVSDYTGRLSNAEVQELTSLIQDYEQRTSIEIAVVIVNDLQGQSARDFAIGLGDAWRVGKAGRNNGIVLLWAPNQRAYSLRVASGLSEELNDSAAAVITSEYLVPNFKDERYYEGLKATVVAITERLGGETWDERMEQRSQKASAAARQSNEALGFMAGIVLLMAAVIVVVTLVHKRRQRQERLSELARAGSEIAGDLEKAEKNASRILQILDDFAKEAPEQDLSKLRENLAKQAERISGIRQDAAALDFTKLESYEQMVSIRTSAESEAGLLESVQQQIANIRTSKQQCQALFEQLSGENFAIADVRDSSRRSQVDGLLNSSRLAYEQARSNSSMSLVDWILINEMLNRSDSQRQEAIRWSQESPYVSTTGWSSGSSTSFSDSSSSSSFDGGGGGGGFSSGSGSDGTY